MLSRFPFLRLREIAGPRWDTKGRMPVTVLGDLAGPCFARVRESWFHASNNGRGPCLLRTRLSQGCMATQACSGHLKLIHQLSPTRLHPDRGYCRIETLPNRMFCFKIGRNLSFSSRILNSRSRQIDTSGLLK